MQSSARVLARDIDCEVAGGLFANEYQNLVGGGEATQMGRKAESATQGVDIRGCIGKGAVRCLALSPPAMPVEYLRLRTA
ncbi:hypothetical protein HYQ46_009155 [Verticillium longisporum]|nr:hypothetical protein HYQ46_009155 [Verticillium longisporum]